MGFDVTAVNIIFFIAVLSVGSVAMGAYWKDAGYVEEARRVEDDRTDERAHTNLTVTSTQYNGGQDRFTVNVKNVGPVVIDISDLAYFVDGALVPTTSYESVTVVGEGSGTDVLLPLETLQIQLSPITVSPSYFQVVTATGAKANWRA